ncbi:hypothetical protein QVD17_14661 [Tagetes erecta]|uniref:Protein kinase domain-containing protein n=1 Tax=Tagetes erecta TaxID=13708 RepID=A0AAD8KNF3_TARER|nr:hypothetical protein QVD17_14661 [Tagetes erecta]
MNHVVLSEPIGTEGYMDPEIEKTKGVTLKSDIYSFGVVLFELLCGREAFLPHEADSFLAPLAKRHYENNTMDEILQSEVLNHIRMNQVSVRSLGKIATTAYSCIQDERQHRPNMNDIVTKLEKALEVHLRLENLFHSVRHQQAFLLADTIDHE